MIYRFHQHASQAAPTPHVCGIHADWHAPYGWNELHIRGGHGFPPMRLLGASRVSIILHNPFGQIPGHPMECLIHERPDYYIDQMSQVISQYDAKVWINTGSPHNTRNWDHERTIELLEKLPGHGVIFDAFWEATGEGMHKNIAFAMDLWNRGWSIGFEGGMPEKYAGVMPFTLQLMIRSQVRKMVNDPAARKGIAPLHENTVLWIDDPDDGSVAASVYAAEQVGSVGVPAEATPEAGLDAFQRSASRPLDAAISCGMTAADVESVWGGAK